MATTTTYRTDSYPCRVYTALLTQTGGDGALTISSGDLTIGVTYAIVENEGLDWNFTNVGAPNNNPGTYFVATGSTPNSWGTDGALNYNTGAPVATVLENTLGGTVVWTYDIVGLYNATLNGVFLPNKTAVFCTRQMPGGGGIVMHGSRFDYNTVSIRVSDSITNVDGELTDASIEIRVYN